MKSTTTLSNYFQSLSQNTGTTNSTLGKQMNNDAHRYLMQKYFFNEKTTTALTVSQQQGYLLPFNYSKMKTVTITIGNLQWTPTEILTRKEWDQLNVFPYYTDIPNNFFIYNGYCNIWPIPSTTGNTITFNYQIRVPDLSIDDYSTGTVFVDNNDTIVTGLGTTWLSSLLVGGGSALNLNLWIRIPSPTGDNNWYQIESVDSDTQITLLQPYQGNTVTGGTYTIGQMPLLLEDFHDLIVFRSLMLYFATINPDPNKHAEFKSLYDEGIRMMDDYVGSKSLNVNLAAQPQMMNPNLFWQA